MRIGKVGIVCETVSYNILQKRPISPGTCLALGDQKNLIDILILYVFFVSENKVKIPIICKFYAFRSHSKDTSTGLCEDYWQ